MSTVTMSKPTADHSEEFEGLFREHYLLVDRTACVITGSPEDPEDVLQTLFLRLMRRSIPPDICKNPKGYFYRAAVDLSLDTIRSRRREVLTSDFSAIEVPIRTDAPKEQYVLDQRFFEALAKLTHRGDCDVAVSSRLLRAGNCEVVAHIARYGRRHAVSHPHAFAETAARFLIRRTVIMRPREEDIARLLKKRLPQRRRRKRPGNAYFTDSFWRGPKARNPL